MTKTAMASKEECKTENSECKESRENQEIKGSRENQERDLVGRIVQKEFKDHGLFLGKVVSYYPTRGFFKVKYEDGDMEDLELHELREILIADGEFDVKLTARKRKLDELLQRNSRKRSRSGPVQKQRPRKKGKFKDTEKDAVSSGCCDPGLEDDGEVKACADEDPNLPQTIKHNDGQAGKHTGAENGGSVEDLEFKSGYRSKRKRDSDEFGDIMLLSPLQTDCKRRPEQQKTESDGNRAVPSVSSDRPLKSQRRRRGKYKTDSQVSLSGQQIECDEIKSPELPRQSQRRRRGKSGVSRLEMDECEGPQRRIRKEKSPCQTAVSAEQQKGRPQRKSARKPAAHIYSRDTDSNVEKDNSSSEESYRISHEEVSSASDLSDIEDSGQIISLSKTIDCPLPPLQPLPPSSGDVPIPEESVPDLLSVYSCLRSFSDLLFVSPFSLEDFVGALNYKSANSLLDSVHVALLRALRRHLEMLLAEGSEAASKCLGQLDWNFLDAVTWPVYLVEYLITQGFSSKYGQGINRLRLLDSEYYRISPSTKLAVLQFLCDDIMEAEEVRAEVNTRLNFEQDTDADGKANLSSSVGGLIGRNLCYSKSKRISCIKADEQRSSTASQVTTESTNLHVDNAVLQSKRSCFQKGQAELMRPGMDSTEDWNSDECRLCGMDGSLICCDGCPSAYHSRCVGVSKAHLPEGAWYCPECMVEKNDAKGSKAFKGLRGAEIFGIDPYERVYFGTCGYVLVSDSTSNPATVYKYYNKNDIKKVLDTLHLSTPFYDGIRSAILQYWGVQDDRNDATSLPKSDTAYSNSPVELSCVSVSEHMVEQDDVKLSVLPSMGSEGGAEIKNCVQDHECFPDSDTTKCKKENRILVTDPCDDKITVLRSLEVASGIVPNSLICESAQEWANISEKQHFDPDTDRTAGQTEYSKNCSLQDQQQIKADVDGTAAQMGASKYDLLHAQEQTELSDVKIAVKTDLITSSSNWEVSFKPNMYINHYVLGDMAASAAANLTVMAAEENRFTNGRGPAKKTLAATVSEQVKAFSKAAVHFCWPSVKKKSMEAPKERCGWCVACKSSSSSRRGCLLNVAAGNVMAGAANIAGGLRPTKNGDGHLPAVAAYMLYIEDSLRGLMVGPWENPDYRKHWRKRVEQASTTRDLRSSLLELELNIRLIALSAGWSKHVDDCFPLVSASQIIMSIAGPTPKRGGGGRRAKKHGASAVMVATSKDAGAFGIYWRRGGKLSNQVFQRAVLPCVMAKRAGRQGGFKRIPGISYAEGLDIPRRNRQYTWRAAVEMARSVSHLAVQVRYLDAFIKWEDLVCPEDSHDGRVHDKEAAAFRKAVFCEKSCEGGVFKYLLDFGNQEDIPICAVKHGVKVEETQDGRKKYWLGESHMPLYLLKRFEERLLQARPNKGSKHVCKDHNRLVKGTTKKDIYAFLLAKAEMNEKCSCTHCRMDLFVRKSVQCNSCQGLFHRECTMASDLLDKSECKFTCYKCYNAILAERKQGAFKSQSKKNTLPLLVRKHVPLSDKMEVHKGSHSQSFGENTARQNHAAVDWYLAQRKKLDGVSHVDGLLRKKNRTDELGENFRKNRLLLACQNNMDASEGPKCFLCREPYNPKLMYVGCEYCKEWFHGDALGLNQENIVDLVGFKCHRCRKKSAPSCPHVKRDIYAKREKLPVKRLHMKVNGDYGEVVGKSDGKPLDVTHGEPRDVSDDFWTMLASEEQAHMEIKSEPNLKDAAQVLPLHNNQPVAEPDLFDNSDCTPVGGETLSPEVDWDFSVTDCLHDEAVCCEEDPQIEFSERPLEAVEAYPEMEPQTIFSFTELLASEDDRVEDLVDLSQDVVGNWSNGFTDNEKYMHSQALGLEGEGYHSSGIMALSNTEETIDCKPANENMRENIKGLQPFDTGDTVSSDKTGKSCIVCNLGEVPPDLQCRGCVLAIHSHCYQWAPGVWTACGWICNSCQGGLPQGQGLYL